MIYPEDILFAFAVIVWVALCVSVVVVAFAYIAGFIHGAYDGWKFRRDLTKR